MHHWPLFDLRITTPRLELRYVDDETGAALMTMAATDGVHAPDFMPFSTPWTRLESPQLEQQGMQHYWRTRAQTSPQSWMVPMAVFDAGVLVGVQDVKAASFAVTRSVMTGSWLGRSHQGKGIGKEMRSAILHLAFDGLGAEVAETSAFADNSASIGVTRALGYRDNGWYLDVREGRQARHLRFIMERSHWTTRRRDDITVEGLEACLPQLLADA